MGNGAVNDFFIGWDHNFVTIPFNGEIAQFIVANAVLTQDDVEWLMATLIPEPVLLQGEEYNLYEKIIPTGVSNYECEERCHTIAKYNDNIYMKGFTHDSTDALEINGRL